MKADDLKVRLGEYDFDKKSKRERDYGVLKLIQHEGYDQKTQVNDIALLKLNDDVLFGDHIRPICLPPSNIVLDDQITSVTGQFETLLFTIKNQQAFYSNSKDGALHRSVAHPVMFCSRCYCPCGSRPSAAQLSVDLSPKSNSALDIKQVAKTLVK